MTRPKVARLFADWYTRVHPSPPSELVALRAQCVSHHVENARIVDAAKYVKLMVHPDKMNEVDRSALVESFRVVDASFPATENQNLLAVMLAGCVAQLIDSGGDEGVVAALAVRTAGCRGTRTVGPRELSKEASDALHSVAIETRERAHAPFPETPPIREVKLGKQPAFTADDVAPNQWDIVAKNDKTLASAIATAQKSVGALAALVEGIRNDVATSLEQVHVRGRDPAVRALQEETQILWWLFGEWSETVQRSFESLSEPGASIILAQELADLTQFVPGHPRQEFLLRRALAKCQARAKECSLHDVITGSPFEWRKACFSDRRSEPIITPLIFALTRSAESPDSTWASSFESVTGLDPLTTCKVFDWGSQLVDETLLLREISSGAP